MKKIIFAAAASLYCLLFSATGNAQPNVEVPQKVKQSFSNRFKSSEFERWTGIQNAFFVATFKENEKWKDAYFTEEGEYKGIGKYITTEQLPNFVQRTIDNGYPKYQIVELYQYDCMENGLCFFVVLENDKRNIILKMDAYGNVTYSQKIKMKQTNSVPNGIVLEKRH